jgi:hypothetical protein
VTLAKNGCEVANRSSSVRPHSPLRGHHSPSNALRRGGRESTSREPALPPTSHPHRSPHLVVISKGIEEGRPPGRVLYWENEGFMVLDEHVPEDPGELDRDELTVVCLDCLIDRHPALARGMDVACRGGAWLATSRAHGRPRGWRIRWG